MTLKHKLKMPDVLAVIAESTKYMDILPVKQQLGQLVPRRFQKQQKLLHAS